MVKYPLMLLLAPCSIVTLLCFAVTVGLFISIYNLCAVDHAPLFVALSIAL